MLALSLDMGGTHIGCAVVRDQQIVANASLDSEGAQNLASLLPSIAETLRGLLGEAGASSTDCGGMAIGFPEIVDARSGHILSTLKKYEDVMHLDLAGWSRETFGIRLRMPYVQEYVAKHAWTAWGKPQVRAAGLGSNAALLGAVPLLLEEF